MHPTLPSATFPDFLALPSVPSKSSASRPPMPRFGVVCNGEWEEGYGVRSQRNSGARVCAPCVVRVKRADQPRSSGEMQITETLSRNSVPMRAPSKLGRGVLHFLCCRSLHGRTRLVGPVLSRYQVDWFGPRSQQVDWRIVSQPELSWKSVCGNKENVWAYHAQLNFSIFAGSPHFRRTPSSATWLKLSSP
jgi:hypothetical protein